MRHKSLLLGLLLFSAGFASNTLLGYFRDTGDLAFKNSNMLRDDGYHYVSPLLMCGISEQVESTSYDSLKTSVLTELEEVQEADDVISVYFRELNSGEWFSINETETYSPASLLKLPLYIAYLKMAESNPELLSQTLTLSNVDLNAAQNFPPQYPMEPGSTATIFELLLAMIQNSDNNAAMALTDNLDESFRNEVYSDLGLDLPSPDGSVDDMTTKEYSHFFRVLYNASYLSHENSEIALKVMAQGNFEDGLVFGLEEGVEMAEKFGERKVLNKDGSVENYELHDCGIIYTSEPYLLCVMTKGKSGFDHLGQLIATISEVIYEDRADSNKESLMYE